MTGNIVNDGVDGNPMVHSPFQDDHTNHINSYVENIIFWSFFFSSMTMARSGNKQEANVGPRSLLCLSYFTLFTQIPIGSIMADRIIAY